MTPVVVAQLLLLVIVKVQPGVSAPLLLRESDSVAVLSPPRRELEED